jgi:hypothetical protein
MIAQKKQVVHPVSVGTVQPSRVQALDLSSREMSGKRLPEIT